MRAQEADAESIAIGYRTRDAAHADSTAGAGYVFNNDRLAERDPHALGHDAPNRICWPASRKRHDHRDRPRRIVLRPSNARYGRQRGSAGNEMQELSSVGKFHGVHVRSPPGRRTVNTEPLPGLLATVTSPPIMRASLRVMARPSPVPPKRCAVVLSAWLNSANSLACCSAVMPMPVSETDTSIQSRPFLTLLALSLTSPSLVNLQALLKRLNRTCRRRMGSTVRDPRSFGTSAVRRFLFWSASWRAVPMTSSINGISCTV